MKRYRVILSDEVETQLQDLYAYIAGEADPLVAKRFVDAIIEQCGKLEHFPKRGASRDNLRQGLRTLVFRRQTIIAYMIDEDAVHVIGIAYRGREVARVLRDLE